MIRILTMAVTTAAALTIAASPAGAASAPAPGTAPSSSGGGDNPGTGTRAPNPVTGEQVYQMICQSCHMADAKGGVGAGQIPALANNPRLAAPSYAIMMVMNGRGAMPWFYDSLNPAQVAAVVGYIRTHFGNTYADPVTAADVGPFARAK